jgi:Tol biopolymer transport system component
MAINIFKRDAGIKVVGQAFIFLLLSVVLSSCQVSNNSRGYQLITEKSDYNGQPTWSLDGSKIIYRPNSDESTVIHDLESGNEKQLSLPIIGHGYGNITWISDSEIAYTPFPSHPAGRIVIFEPSSNTERVFHVPDGIFDLCWNQNEKVFIFITEQLVTLSSTSVFGNIVMKFDPESEEFSPLYWASEDHVVTDIACRRDGRVFQ